VRTPRGEPRFLNYFVATGDVGLQVSNLLRTTYNYIYKYSS